MSPWKPIKCSDLDEIHMNAEDCSTNISVKQISNIPIETENKMSVSTFPIISTLYMEICVTIATRMLILPEQNTLYVEANVINMYTTYQVHPPYDCKEEDFIFKFSDSDSLMKRRGLLNKHFCKIKVKTYMIHILIQKNVIFHFSHNNMKNMLP